MLRIIRAINPYITCNIEACFFSLACLYPAKFHQPNLIASNAPNSASFTKLGAILDVLVVFSPLVKLLITLDILVSVLVITVSLVFTL